MSWHGQLTLRDRRDGARTLAHDAHEGPLRVLKALYPDGDGVCHHVLVHPPGGIAGGDRLHIDVDVGEGAHALITSAGAARFYRSSQAVASQAAQLRLQCNARLEWLPLETIAFPGCRASNQVQFELASGAQCLGWDLLALGLPAADQAFALDPRLVLLRVLAPRVEPLFGLLCDVRAAWRASAWQMPAATPRVWRT